VSKVEVPEIPLRDYLNWYIGLLKGIRHNASPGQVEIPIEDFDGLLETMEAIRDEKFTEDTVPK